jgi:protein-ribulosamine 3-kinase
VIDAALAAELERALGSAVVRSAPVSGGDINEAHSLWLADGRRAFVKTSSGAAPGLFPAEARGLDWLRTAGSIRVPRVLSVSGGGDGRPAFLALEWIERGRPRTDFDARLGRMLAALHRFGAVGFGLDEPNFIGRLPQDNRPCATWLEFYRERRLMAELARAPAGLLPAALRRDFERLFARLGDWIGPSEPPARLHGDLWGGNLHVDEHGDPVLIDPACYGGHREIDLAMMRLFGGFGARAFAAYAEAYPLAPGHEERVDLYQLYPLLVHVNHFGASYVGAVERALRRYV